MNTLNFADLGLSPEILKAVADLGFEQASPIQSAAIPILMEGHDVVGQSQTGSGKTAAFAIPAIEICAAQDRMVQVLIMCPTRELAMQVADEVHKLSAHKRGIHAVPIYGGASYERQFHELKKGVQIVIGTPGRIMDHMQRGTLRLEAVKMVVLDEADRMLDMGFREDIEHILKATPKERQTVFFSATVSKPIRDLIERHSREPKSVKIEQKTLTVPAIEQWYFEVPQRNKREALLRLVDFHGFKLGIVFCNTQRMVDELADDLVAQGISADRLHGGLSQTQRTRVMNKFKQAEFEFLVATDVAARGIDVDDLELVVNYDLPYDAEDYVHRIGRTGRAGRKGLAATFVTGRDIYKIQHLCPRPMRSRSAAWRACSIKFGKSSSAAPFPWHLWTGFWRKATTPPTSQPRCSNFSPLDQPRQRNQPKRNRTNATRKTGAKSGRIFPHQPCAHPRAGCAG
jgi:ATP-dependent RNA helicase DeaD